MDGNLLNLPASRLALFLLFQEKVTESGRKSLARHPMVISPFSGKLPDGMRGKREGALGEAEGETIEKEGGFWKYVLFGKSEIFVWIFVTKRK